jgi:hypothetical protein
MAPDCSTSLAYGLLFIDRLHHRLFTVHVLAGVECVYADARVPMVGPTDNHRVDVLAREDFAVIARGEDPAAVNLLGGVTRAPAAESDAGNSYAVDGGTFTRTFSSWAVSAEATPGPPVN